MLIIWCVLNLSRVQLCDPMDCSLPGSSVHGILQAEILEWVSISSSRGSSRPRDWTRVSRVSSSSRQILYHGDTSEALIVRRWDIEFGNLRALGSRLRTPGVRKPPGMALHPARSVRSSEECAGTDEDEDRPVSGWQGLSPCAGVMAAFSRSKRKGEHTQNPDEVSRVPSHTPVLVWPRCAAPLHTPTDGLILAEGRLAARGHRSLASDLLGCALTHPSHLQGFCFHTAPQRPAKRDLGRLWRPEDPGWMSHTSLPTERKSSSPQVSVLHGFTCRPGLKLSGPGPST